jgi:acetate kinase
VDAIAAVAEPSIEVTADLATKDLILVLNSGSSSLKFGVYRRGENDDDEQALLTGSAEGIGHSSGTLRIQAADGKSLLQRQQIHESQNEALAALAGAMREHMRDAPVAVGHRVVHGGPKLCRHQRITPAVLSELQAAIHFAPLHIPQALALIKSAQSIFPSAAQFACFDDAFHQTMPEVACRFAIPSRYFDAGIRRYGFHGISYESLVHHFGNKLPPLAIFAHLGNGSSLCALRDGKSIDTTMGLTPTGGIPMGTRSGDLDPGVILYLLRNEKLNGDQLEEMLNRRSGLFALSSGQSDVKLLEERARANDRDAILALDVLAISIRKAIGAYVALLGGVNLLVFTGGIGEHSERIRTAATQGLGSLGLTADQIQVVPTEEERQIARHCRAMMTQARS